MSAPRRGDDGSVLVLILGVVVILAMLLGVVVDTGRLYLARRSLDSVTDGAALAGAQAVDVESVYANGTSNDLALDHAAVARSVDGYLDGIGVERELEGFALADVDVAGAEVSVRTAATVRLPFLGPFTHGTERVTIHTESTARNHVR